VAVAAKARCALCGVGRIGGKAFITVVGSKSVASTPNSDLPNLAAHTPADF
jgi:hypothetical protein